MPASFNSNASSRSSSPSLDLARTPSATSDEATIQIFVKHVTGNGTPPRSPPFKSPTHFPKPVSYTHLTLPTIYSV